LIFLFIPFSASAVKSTAIYFSAPTTAAIVSGVTKFYVTCPTDATLTEIYVQPDQTQTATHNLAFTLDGISLGTTTFTQATNFADVGLTGLSVDCNNSPMELVLSGWTSGTTYMRYHYADNTAWPAPDFSIANATTSVSQWYGYSMEVTFSGGGGGGSTEYIYIPVDDQIDSLACSHTSTSSSCDFTYSTSTSSSTAQAIYDLIEEHKNSPLTVFNTFILLFIFLGTVVFIGTITYRFL